MMTKAPTMPHGIWARIRRFLFGQSTCTQDACESKIHDAITEVNLEVDRARKLRDAAKRRITQRRGRRHDDPPVTNPFLASELARKAAARRKQA